MTRAILGAVEMPKRSAPPDHPSVRRGGGMTLLPVVATRTRARTKEGVRGGGRRRTGPSLPREGATRTRKTRKTRRTVRTRTASGGTRSDGTALRPIPSLTPTRLLLHRAKKGGGAGRGRRRGRRPRDQRSSPSTSTRTRTPATVQTQAKGLARRSRVRGSS